MDGCVEEENGQLRSPANCTLLGVTTLWPQVYTSPSHVSTTVWRLAAATASMTLPCRHHAKPLLSLAKGSVPRRITPES